MTFPNFSASSRKVNKPQTHLHLRLRMYRHPLITRVLACIYILAPVLPFNSQYALSMNVALVSYVDSSQRSAALGCTRLITPHSLPNAASRESWDTLLMPLVVIWCSNLFYGLFIDISSIWSGNWRRRDIFTFKSVDLESSSRYHRITTMTSSRTSLEKLPRSFNVLNYCRLQRLFPKLYYNYKISQDIKIISIFYIRLVSFFK